MIATSQNFFDIEQLKTRVQGFIEVYNGKVDEDFQNKEFDRQQYHLGIVHAMQTIKSLIQFIEDEKN